MRQPSWHDGEKMSDIEKRIEGLKEAICRYNKTESVSAEQKISIASVCSNTIKGLEMYPYEYRLFLSEIGRLHYGDECYGFEVLCPPYLLGAQAEGLASKESYSIFNELSLEWELYCAFDTETQPNSVPLSIPDSAEKNKLSNYSIVIEERETWPSYWAFDLCSERSGMVGILGHQEVSHSTFLQHCERFLYSVMKEALRESEH